ncbi:FecR domain-containing protein, partial [Rhodoplanes sp. TEM]
LAIAVAAPELVRVVRDLGADHVTATGRQDRVVLPDGSTLVLNSDTAVGLDFAADRRTVRLIRGEAFLDVVRDPDRPFHVTGHFADVEVVGTAFAVRAGDTADDVVLQRGRLAVRPLAAAPAAAASVTLAPLQAVSVGAAGAGRVAAVDGDTAFAWLDGRLRFRDRPLGRVLDELRRYHRGVIIVADRRLEALRVSGNYRIDDPALVVASLADAVGARLTRLSDHVLILR